MNEILYNGMTPLSLIPRQHIGRVELRHLSASKFMEYKKSYEEGIPHSKAFDLSNLVKHKEYQWMLACEFYLVDYAAEDGKTEEDAVEELLAQIAEIAVPVGTDIAHKGMPCVSIDFETFGLNNTPIMVNGSLLPVNPIVGICIGLQDSEGLEYGVYIPVNHNEMDGVKNLSQFSVRKILQNLVDNYFTIYHNSLFDRDLLSLYRIKLNYNYADTMLIAIACQLRASSKDSVGLKQLSEEHLGRKMIERGVADIGSAEQLGTWIGETLCAEFVKEFCQGDTPTRKQEKLEQFYKKLYNTFTIEVKHKELKAGNKTVFNSPDSVLQKIIDFIDDWDWIEEKVRFKLSEACYIVSSYRTLLHYLGIVSLFVRFAYNDDIGLIRCGQGLKFMGAITTRYSNEKGTGGFDRVLAEIPSNAPVWADAKRFTKVPEKVAAKIGKEQRKPSKNLIVI